MEAMVGAKAWKAARGVKRPWSQPQRRLGMSGSSLDAWVRGMAVRYPGQVQV